MKRFIVIFLGFLFQISHLSAQQRTPYVQQRSPNYGDSANNVQNSPNRDEGNTSRREIDFFGEQVKPKTKGRPALSAKLKNQSGISFNVQLGYMYGELEELVMASSSDKYDLDSQLTWKLQDTLNISVGFEIILRKIYLKLGASLPMVLTKAKMEDRDWLFDSFPAGTSASKVVASAISHYSASDTENDLSFSAYGMFAINLLEKGRAPRLDLGASFMYMTWGWRALATEGLYYVDDQGAFAGFIPAPSSGNTIDYRIHYLIPAVSVRFSVRWGIYGTEVFLNYSPFTVFFDRDEHIVTKITSDGFGLLGQMVWGGLSNYLWITDNWAINFGLRGKVLFRTSIGSLIQLNSNTGVTTTTQNAAGSEYFDIEGFVGVTLHL
ncbi:omptin family outer membrane protease [Candidatus Haliotispira prima]|uniref:Omptin family outer membrane protease n=1 Tax=Candidatus Haliotispira prima TaxID=3034016 RepID=A0ABY8MF21_9SPIO|nr:omptin family outer membrane protease [Candidatus Haliotispira prima]